MDQVGTEIKALEIAVQTRLSDLSASSTRFRERAHLYGRQF
jgi:hypothetical protein